MLCNFSILAGTDVSRAVDCEQVPVLLE